MKPTNSLSYSNLKTRNEQAYNCKTGKPCIAAQCAATYSLMRNPCNTDTSPPSFLVMPAPLPLSCPACTSAMLFGSDIQKQVFAYRSPHSHLTGHLLSLPSSSSRRRGSAIICKILTVNKIFRHISPQKNVLYTDGAFPPCRLTERTRS